MANNLNIVIGVQALVDRAAIELDIPHKQLLTHMVLNVLGDRTDSSRPPQDVARVARVVPTGAHEIPL